MPVFDIIGVVMGRSDILMDTNRKQGKVQVSPAAIAAIARDTALASYGVVDMANKNPFEIVIQKLNIDRSQTGVDVTIEEDRIIVDLYVVVQYGTRISEVAQGLINRVHYELEKTLGMEVEAVNVHVQDLRIPEGEEAF